MDYVQWPAVLTEWDTVSYTYDPSGRRIAKSYDGHVVMKYLYDGDSILAQYDATGALVHKYIYGPGVDQPICMIDVSDANATYYYHFDGLGSCVALTDSAGAVANLYEYSIFGEVSASDPNHPNRFLFTGREFDVETGLYYYRARYYNPYIGRFLQTDPIGYGDGMNLYAYCGNRVVTHTDPFGAQMGGPGFPGGSPITPGLPGVPDPDPRRVRHVQNVINNPYDAFLWYLFGNGGDAIMGPGLIGAFKETEAYSSMINEIESLTATWSEKAKPDQYIFMRWTHEEVTTDPITNWGHYKPVFNLAVGTISSVDVQVVIWKNKDCTVGYQAQFVLDDLYNFRGSNNVLLSPLRLVGHEYTMQGVFFVEADGLRHRDPNDPKDPCDPNERWLIK